MTAASTNTDTATHPDLVVTRIYEAPRALVWEAITDPAHLAAWFGPHGFDNKSANVELRAGGEYSVLMSGPGGREFNAVYTISEVAPIERLTMQTEQGDHEAENFFRVRLIFELAERGTQTILTLTGQVLEAEANATGPLAGTDTAWSQSMERLAGTIGCLVLDAPADQPTIVISRMFDAPRELIWQAMTRPEHLRHWWGPHGSTNPEYEMDVRVGGKWRIVQRFPDGREFVFKGEYREIEPPEKIVQTFGMEGMFEGSEMVESMTLTALGDRTLLKVTSAAKSIEDRDGMLASGMSGGANATYERLATYLKQMPKET